MEIPSKDICAQVYFPQEHYLKKRYHRGKLKSSDQMEIRSRCCFCVRHKKCTDKLSVRQQSIYCTQNARITLSRKHWTILSRGLAISIWLHSMIRVSCHLMIWASPLDMIQYTRSSYYYNFIYIYITRYLQKLLPFRRESLPSVLDLSPVILITTLWNLVAIFYAIMSFLSLIMVFISKGHHKLLPFVGEKWHFF